MLCSSHRRDERMTGEARNSSEVAELQRLKAFLGTLHFVVVTDSIQSLVELGSLLISLGLKTLARSISSGHPGVASQVDQLIQAEVLSIKILDGLVIDSLLEISSPGLHPFLHVESRKVEGSSTLSRQNINIINRIKNLLDGFPVSHVVSCSCFRF
nr:TPA_asm: hypothetical protein [Sclerotinia sclerotiorum negative-stranded RNA virus 5]